MSARWQILSRIHFIFQIIWKLLTWRRKTICKKRKTLHGKEMKKKWKNSPISPQPFHRFKSWIDESVSCKSIPKCTTREREILQDLVQQEMSHRVLCIFFWRKFKILFFRWYNYFNKNVRCAHKQETFAFYKNTQSLFSTENMKSQLNSVEGFNYTRLTWWRFSHTRWHSAFLLLK